MKFVIGVISIITIAACLGNPIPLASGLATTAIRVNASGEGVRYAREYFDWDSGGITMMAWAYVPETNIANHDNAILSVRGAGILYLQAGNRKLSLYTGEGVGFTNNTVVSPGQWHHFALVRDGLTWRTYIDGVADVSDTTFEPTGDPQPYFGNSKYDDWFDGRVTAGKIWLATLSPAEVQAEISSYDPVRTANIWSVVYMRDHTDLADRSGMGHTPTAIGTLTTEEGPAALTPPPPPTYITILDDSFEVSEWNSLWTEDTQNDWSRSSEQTQSGGFAAQFTAPGTDSQLTSQNLNLQGKTRATITFQWLISSQMDVGEYIAFDVSTDGGSTWTEQLRRRGNVDAENVWAAVNVTLSNINNLMLRFRGTASASTEKGFIDVVKVTAE